MLTIINGFFLVSLMEKGGGWEERGEKKKAEIGRLNPTELQRFHSQLNDQMDTL